MYFYQTQTIVLLNLNSIGLITLGILYIKYNKKWFNFFICINGFLACITIFLFSIKKKTYKFLFNKKLEPCKKKVNGYFYKNFAIFFDSAIKYIITQNKILLVSVIDLKKINNHWLYNVIDNVVFIFDMQKTLRYIIAADDKFYIIQNRKILVYTEEGSWENQQKISNNPNSFVFKNSYFSFIHQDINISLKKNQEGIFEVFL